MHTARRFIEPLVVDVCGTPCALTRIPDTVCLMGGLRLTPALAERINDELAYSGQRQLDRSVVDSYREQMVRGEFVPTDGFVFARHNGKLILCDGQHRCKACAAAGVTLGFPITVVDCATDEDVRRLYFGIDINKPRKLQTALAQIASDLGADKQAQVNALNGATLLIENHFVARWPGGYISSFRHRERQCRGWAEQFRALTHVILDRGVTKGVTQRILRSPVIAVILMTLRFQHESALEFWGTMARDDGLPKADIRKLLLTFLQETPCRGSGDWNRIARKCANAWTAWFREEPADERTALKRVVKVSAPIVIAGTPYWRDRGAHVPQASDFLPPYR